MSSSNANEKLNKRAADKLVRAHQLLEEERLVLAIRYRHHDRDLFLFEVLGNFPGDDDDAPFKTVFDPSAELLILGKLHLTLASPNQLQTAIRKRDKIIGELMKDGKVLFHDGSEEVKGVKKQLGLK